MSPLLRKIIRNALVTVAAVVVAAGAYWAYVAQQKRSQERAIATLVGEASATLKEALAAEASPDDVKRLDGALARLRAARASRQRPLADAAENYLLGARAVLEKRADAVRLAQSAAASRRQLIAHMSTPRGRDDSWIRQAADLKKRMDQAYFEQNVALDALGQLLRSLPETESALEPKLGRAALLPDAAREAALKRVEVDQKKAADDRSKVGGLIVR